MTAEEAKAFGVRAIPFQMDIASLSDCRRTVAKAMMEFGKIDALFCNIIEKMDPLVLFEKRAKISRRKMHRLGDLCERIVRVRLVKHHLLHRSHVGVAAARGALVQTA